MCSSVADKAELASSSPVAPTLSFCEFSLVYYSSFSTSAGFFALNLQSWPLLRFSFGSLCSVRDYSTETTKLNRFHSVYLTDERRITALCRSVLSRNGSMSLCMRDSHPLAVRFHNNLLMCPDYKVIVLYAPYETL